MSFRIVTAIILTAILLAPSVGMSKLMDLKRSSSKVQTESERVVQPLYPMEAGEADFAPTFLPEVQCTLRMVGDSYWAVESWLVGDEIYKVYQDVSLLNNECSYPLYVTHVAFEIQCTYAGTLWVQADIEELDSLSTENCPYPGYVLGITEDLPFDIPGSGSYLIIMPFDEPVMVDGPFFAGCYFAAETYNLNPSLITDDDPYLCVSWNDWGEGYVDLISNPYFNFPGNLVMYSLGYSEQGEFVIPKMSIYAPLDSSTQAGQFDIRVADLEDTVSFFKCRFEYYSLLGWNLIGEDVTRDITFRNGVVAASSYPGYSVTWDVSTLPEGWYDIRAMLYTDSEAYVADTIEIYLDNTPLFPTVQWPRDGQSVCDTVTISVDVPDEDVSFVQFELRTSEETISTPLPLLNQYSYGDVDGDTLDMNPYTQGEFGSFYNGPTICASVLEYFSDLGYGNLMNVGIAPVSVRQAVELIADSARVRLRYGSEDDNLIASLADHIAAQGAEFHVSSFEDLTLNSLLYYTAYRRGVILLGIGEPFGHWLGMLEYSPPADDSQPLPCTIYDTRGGQSVQSTLQFSPTLSIDYQGLFRNVDKVIAVYPRADTTSRQVIGGDFNSSDGWSYLWNSTGFEDGYYLLAAIGIDITGHVGEGTSRIFRSCSPSYIQGDANFSGNVDIDDVVYLIGYIFSSGPEPQPVLDAGDCNCSEFVDIDDVVYLVGYIFTGGPPPCE